MKVDEYEFDDNELNEFVRQLRDILNFGKYQTPIITSLPDWAARPGEKVIFNASTGGYTEYFYSSSAWISSWSVGT